MIPSVTHVQTLEGYKLLLTFQDNVQKIFNLSPYLTVGKFAELKDKELFNTARVSFDSIEWDNSLDIDPELLYTEGEKV